MNMTDKEFNDLAELDILAAEAGGYVVPQSYEDSKVGFKIREAAKLCETLGRPLTDKEAAQFKYTI